MMDPIAARCPTDGVCPPCREGFGHWRPETSECPDCGVHGPHYCRAYGTMREITHLRPHGDQAVTPCCARMVLELPRFHRLIVDPKLVTCGA